MVLNTLEFEQFVREIRELGMLTLSPWRDGESFAADVTYVDPTTRQYAKETIYGATQMGLYQNIKARLEQVRPLRTM